AGASPAVFDALVEPAVDSSQFMRSVSAILIRPHGRYARRSPRSMARLTAHELSLTRSTTSGSVNNGDWLTQPPRPSGGGDRGVWRSTGGGCGRRGTWRPPSHAHAGS